MRFASSMAPVDRERDRERERERVVPKREEPDWDMVPERAEPSVTSVAIQKEQVVRMVRQAQAQSSFSFGGAR